MSIIIGLAIFCLFWIFCLSNYGKKLELVGEGGWIPEVVGFIFSRIKRLFRWLYMTHAGAYVVMGIFSLFAVSILFFNTLNPVTMLHQAFLAVKYKRIKNLEREGGHEEYVRKFREKERRKHIKAHDKILAKDPKKRRRVDTYCYKVYRRFVTVKKGLLHDRDSEIKKFNSRCKSKYDNESCKGYYNNIDKYTERLVDLSVEERWESSGYCSFVVRQPDGMAKRKYDEFHQMKIQ